MTSSRECVNELSVSIKSREFLDRLSYRKLLIRDCAARSYLVVQ